MIVLIMVGFVEVNVFFVFKLMNFDFLVGNGVNLIFSIIFFKKMGEWILWELKLC